MKKIIVLILSLFIIQSCSTSPDKIDAQDANTVISADKGIVIDVVPVRIRGAKSEIGAAAGAAIGGIAAKQIGSGSGQDIAQIVGAVAGGVIGYYSPVVLGEHNGFEYLIRIDGVNKPVVIIQGVSAKGYNFRTGDKVTVVYGTKVRVVPAKM